MLSADISDLTTVSSLSGVAQNGYGWALAAEGVWGAARGMWLWIASRALGTATEVFAGGVTRAMLEAAASGGGPTVRVVTTVDGALSGSRVIYAATGESADAVAAAAGGSTKYVANIPKDLISQMERAGMVTTQRTVMGGALADTYVFTQQGAEFVAKFFRAVH